MEFLQYLFETFLHLDEHLAVLVGEYGTWAYLLLFLIILCETGLVAMPFLPGDSLLFAAGSMAAVGALSPHVLFFLLSIAAVLGDTVNYAAGHFLGSKVFRQENSRIFKREYLDRTNRFFAIYGGKTIILARFVPIVRTFAPFVAGVGAMKYSRFLLYNVAGGIFWVALFIYGGYFFGGLPFVKRNFEIVILAIVLLSVTPAFLEYARARGRAPSAGI